MSPLRRPPLPATPTRDVVLTGDGARTWWDLAATHLGDGTAWRDLWDLNQGRVQADGTVLTTERVVLQPGWTVLVPATTERHRPVAAVAAAADDNRGVDVTVQPGDTLSEIAADHGINDWTRVWPANAGRAEPDGARFTDPDYIEPGWTITIPTPTDMGDNTGHAPGVGDNVGDNATVVADGDTLSQIAADHGVPLDAVVAANIGRVQADGSQLTDPDDIRPGWRLVIPAMSPTVLPLSPLPLSPLPTRTHRTGRLGARIGNAARARTRRRHPRRPRRCHPARFPSSRPPMCPAERRRERPRRSRHRRPSADTSRERQLGVHGRRPVRRPSCRGSPGPGCSRVATLLALIRHRRRQFRYRSPGRSITQTPPELRDAERALLTAGGSGMGDVTFLDRALRGLTRAAADGLARLPDVVAARLTTDALELILAVPDDHPPAPWRRTVRHGLDPEPDRRRPAGR